MTDHDEKPLRWSDLFGSIPPKPGPAPDVTTAEVRARYMDGIRADLWGLGSHTMDDYGAAYDRWLAKHDAEVAARALREAADKYQLGGWAESIPRGDTRPALILGMAQQAIDWLRARADGLGQP